MDFAYASGIWTPKNAKKHEKKGGSGGGSKTLDGLTAGISEKYPFFRVP